MRVKTAILISPYVSLDFMKEVYEPAEDSFLLLEQVKLYAKGNCLDMGTGSGLQAAEAAKRCDSVLAADLNPGAVAATAALLKPFPHAKAIKSNLFSKVKDVFDTIIFNPPYLPASKYKDIALDGGKKGHEIIGRFLKDASPRLKPDGTILLVFSSATRKEKVDELILDYGFESEILSEKKMFFETLFCCKISKSAWLRELEARKITGIRLLAKGHRGIVFTGTMNRVKVAIKIERHELPFQGRIKNEAEILLTLNKKGIGPRIIAYGNNFMIYRYVGGLPIVQYLTKATKKESLATISEVFRQLEILDKLLISKEEMHHPVKHIIISRKPVMIDFERAHKTLHPKNVTQFCQFIVSGRITEIIRKKKIRFSRQRVLDKARLYKNHKIDAMKIMAELK